MSVRTISHLFGDLADRLNTGAVQVSVVLACLDELMTLDVSFHLFTRHDEVVVATVDLVRPASPCRICQRHNAHLLVNVTQTTAEKIDHHHHHHHHH